MAEWLAAIDVALLPGLWFTVVLAAVLRAFTGFGFALAAVPVLSLMVPPVEAVVVGASLALSGSVMSLPTYWGKYPLRPLVPMIALSLVGTVVGAFVLGQISVKAFQLCTGVAVVLACVLLGLYRPAHQTASASLTGLTGLLSGLMNGALAMPGPPVIVYAMLTEGNPERSRALLMTFFLFAGVLALISYGVAGLLSLRALGLIVLALPFMFIGDRIGYWLFLRYGSGVYRRVAIGALLAVGATMLWRALW